MAEDDYPDISFTRPYQKHEIVIADFDESTLSSVHGDYDGMKMPVGGLNLGLGFGNQLNDLLG